MNRVILLLLVAGLVVGVVFVGGNFMSRRSSTSGPAENPETEMLDEAEPAKEVPLEEKSETQQETDGMYKESDYTGNPGDVDDLDFKVDTTTSAGKEYTVRFRIKDPAREAEALRIDSTREDGSSMILILRHGEKEGWMKEYSSGEWIHFTGLAFSQIWRSRAEEYLAYQVTDWKAMEGREFTVSSSNGNARVYDIRVNEGLPNSIYTRG